MSDSPGLVDFAAGPVDSVLCFEYSFNLKLISPARKKKIPFFGREGKQLMRRSSELVTACLKGKLKNYH